MQPPPTARPLSPSGKVTVCEQTRTVYHHAPGSVVRAIPALLFALAAAAMAGRLLLVPDAPFGAAAFPLLLMGLALYIAALEVRDRHVVLTPAGVETGRRPIPWHEVSRFGVAMTNQGGKRPPHWTVVCRRHQVEWPLISVRDGSLADPSQVDDMIRFVAAGWLLGIVPPQLQVPIMPGPAPTLGGFLRTGVDKELRATAWTSDPANDQATILDLAQHGAGLSLLDTMPYDGARALRSYRGEEPGPRQTT